MMLYLFLKKIENLFSVFLDPLFNLEQKDILYMYAKTFLKKQINFGSI